MCSENVGNIIARPASSSYAHIEYHIKIIVCFNIRPVSYRKPYYQSFHWPLLMTLFTYPKKYFRNKFIINTGLY